MNFIERPDLTDRYPAIDGVKKVDRNHRIENGNTCGEDYVHFDKAEEPIRQDILRFLEMSHSEFNTWFNDRLKRVEIELDNYTKISDIPMLTSGIGVQTVGEYHALKSQVDFLIEAKKTLLLLQERRNEVKK